jgi:hypothetical protein
MIDHLNKLSRFKLVRSPIGTKESHRATVRGLGLRKAEQRQRTAGHSCSAWHDQQNQPIW